MVDIVVIEQAEGQTHIPHPLHIVNGCIKLLENLEGCENDLINYDPKIDEIWVVFDRDSETFVEAQYIEVKEKCAKHNINIGFTNPTFEIWLLLHLPDFDKYEKNTLLLNERTGGKRSKRFVEKELSNRLVSGYCKNDIGFERFLKNVDFAIEQENQIAQNVEDIFNQVGSNIGILISKMKKS